MKKEHYIYCLYDLWDVPVWIGRGRNPSQRIKAGKRRLGLELRGEVVAGPMTLHKAQVTERALITKHRDVLFNKYVASSAGNLGIKTDRAVVERVRAKNIGKKRTPEQRERIRQSKLGTKFTVEARSKMSESAKKRGVNWAAVAKAAQSNTGKRRTPEQRERMGASRRGKPFTAKHKKSLKLAWIARRELKALLQSGYDHPRRLVSLSADTRNSVEAVSAT